MAILEVNEEVRVGSEGKACKRYSFKLIYVKVYMRIVPLGRKNLPLGSNRLCLS